MSRYLRKIAEQRAGQGRSRGGSILPSVLLATGAGLGATALYDVLKLRRMGGAAGLVRAAHRAASTLRERSGVPAAQYIRQRLPNVQVITTRDEARRALEREMLRAGASRADLRHPQVRDIVERGADEVMWRAQQGGASANPRFSWIVTAPINSPAILEHEMGHLVSPGHLRPDNFLGRASKTVWSRWGHGAEERLAWKHVPPELRTPEERTLRDAALRTYEGGFHLDRARRFGRAAPLPTAAGGGLSLLDGHEKRAVVRHEGGKWVLYTRDGSRVLGRHDSPQEAYGQEYAIQKSKERQAKTAEQQVDGYTRKGPSGPVLVAPYSRRGEPAELSAAHTEAANAVEKKVFGGVPNRRPQDRRFGVFDDDKLVAVARVNEKPLQFWEKDNDYEKLKKLDPRAWISAMAVDPDYRGKGYATKLQQFVMERYGRVMTGTGMRSDDAMRHINRKLGFEQILERGTHGSRPNQIWFHGGNQAKKPGHEDLPREEVIGIPDRKRFVPIPVVEQPAVWSYALQEHDAERRGKHLDLRLGHDGNAFSWALTEWPAPGKSTWAIEQPTHTEAYMAFQGRIEEGYGKGDVALKERAEIIVHEAGPGKIVFSVVRRRGSEDLALLQVGKDDPRVWVAVNMSPKPELVAPAQYKPKFRPGTADELDPEKPDTVWSAKIDGAHGLLLLQGGKRARVFSYREPVGGGLIEWTHKIPGLFQQKAPTNLKDTLLRVEVYAQKDGRPAPVEQVSGLLNQGILGSRAAQSRGPKLRVALIDVERYRGKNLAELPWEQKDLVLRAVQQALPFFERPEQATTPDEKRALLERIRSGKHPQTEEGVVERALRGGPTRKGVLKETDDVYLTATFPARAGSKYEGKGVGGFTYARTPDGPTAGRVGTGLSDALRRELYEQPNRYLGAVARIRGKKYTSGSGRGAAFVGWHPDWESSQEKSGALAGVPDLEKLAEVLETFKPFPHQIRPLKQYVDNDGVLVLAAGTGVGKTYTAVAGNEIQRSLGKARRALVVTPTGLRLNFAKDGVQKFTNSSVQIVGNQEEQKLGYKTVGDVGPDADYTVIGYELFRTDPVGLMKRTGADTLILDEFHTTRNERSLNHRAAKQARQLARNFIGLTGSLVNNDPNEIAPLLDIAINDGFLTRDQFDSFYKRKIGQIRGFFGGLQGQYQLVNLKDLQQRIGPVISYMDTEDLRAEDMPKKEVETVDVEMSGHQKDLYNWALDKVGPTVAFKIRNNLPVSQKEAETLFAQIAAARKASNSLATLDRSISLAQSAEQTPKVRRLLDDLEEHLRSVPDAQAVIYSNLIQGGVDVLHAGLAARGIPHGLFVGAGREVGGDTVSTEARAQAVSDFQQGKSKVIVLSGAGKEGLDFPNATAFLSLDGHFNPEVVRQAEARAIRLKGLSHRPVEERQVLVRRYRSVLPQPGFWARMFGGSEKEFSVDEWTYNTAQRKHVLNRMLRNAVKAVSSAKPNPEQPIELPVPVPYVPVPATAATTATATRAPTTPATPLPAAPGRAETPVVPAGSMGSPAAAPQPARAALDALLAPQQAAKPQGNLAGTTTATATPARTTPATALPGASPNRYLRAAPAGPGGFWRRLQTFFTGHGPAGEKTPGRTWVDAPAL